MKKLILALAAVFLWPAGQSLADGYGRRPTDAACCDSARSWSGFYLGAGIGAGAVVHELTATVPGLASASLDGIGGEGIFGTVTVGYDHQIGRAVVFGIFADYDFSNISSDISAASLFNASLDHKWSWSVGGRLGFLTSPSTLWYGSAGYTQARFDLDSTIGSLDLDDFRGYFLGLGVESQLGAGWALRAEYRFTQFSSETVFSAPGLVNVDLEPSMHTARVALTYKFGRREEMAAPIK
jgi:outer membrane immunogenic protein